MYKNKATKTKDIVIEIFNSHKDWNSGQIHEEYLKRVDPKDARKLNAIQKQLEKIKSDYKKFKGSGLDQEWHFGLLRNREFMTNNPGFNIHPDAVDRILKLKELAENKKLPFTARQVFWVNLFYNAIGSDDQDKYLAMLYDISRVYSDYELLCALKGKEFNTAFLEFGELNNDDLIRRLESMNNSVTTSKKSKKVTLHITGMLETIHHLEEVQARPEPPRQTLRSLRSLKQTEAKKEGE